MTVRAALILSVLTALLALASPSFAATRATTAAPTGLHAFLLRVDEPRTEVFSRTPAFAWNPVAGCGALRVPALDERLVPGQRNHLRRTRP